MTGREAALLFTQALALEERKEESRVASNNPEVSVRVILRGMLEDKGCNFRRIKIIVKNDR